MKETNLPVGLSDPLSYTCTCPAFTDSNGGLVLLFYRYFGATPALPPSFAPQANDPSLLAAFHSSLTQSLGLGGKIRVAKEGYNITVGGTREAIERYVSECLTHWSFSSLQLDTETEKREYFKPTPGCSCVFGTSSASVRVTEEITPMGVTNYVPSNWDSIDVLSPAEFHAACWSEERKVLVDVRNHYESRIGYFVDPVSGGKALRPGVRRFGQWPLFVKRRGLAEIGEEGGMGGGRRILSYCTGGIRCEKGARFLAENLRTGLKDGDKVCTLKGGIAAYLMWMKEEIEKGRKTREESLFKGRNYVFDARGSLGLDGDGSKVARCHVCGVLEDRLSKCRSKGCHLVLVVCAACEGSDPRCCLGCVELSTDKSRDESRRPICLCELERERQLWGVSNGKQQPNVKGWRKNKRSGAEHISVLINPID
jgi:predicted sulfurtransferase